MAAASQPAEEVYYDAYGSAWDLMESDAPEIVLSGPAGTGKSRACLEKVNWLCEAYPGLRALMVRKTRRSLTESGMVTFRDKVLIPGQRVKWVAQDQQWRYLNGSRLAVAGLDKPGKVMSSEWDVIYCQEATELSEADWEALSSRLRNGKGPYHQLVGDCNPDAPTHWLRRRAEGGRVLMLESRHEDNPTVTQEYLARLEALTGVRYLRLCKGIWAAAEGMVYEDAWDPARHLLRRSTFSKKPDSLRGDCGIDPTWPRYLAIDWGYRNPAAIQWWARRPDGELLMYRERYVTMQLVEDLAREALDLMGWKMAPGGALVPTREDADPLPREIVADHDAEDRATWERHFGMAVYPADKGKDSINTGIQAVTKRLTDGRLAILEGSTVERDPLLDGAKRPCSTAEEVESYVWDTRAGRPPKEQPIDEHNHGLDALRYMVTYFDRGLPDAGTITLDAVGF